MSKKLFITLKNLLFLMLVMFLVISCEEDKEVTLSDLSSFGQNFNQGCGDFVVYAFSPDKRYALQIKSDEFEFLTENGVAIDLKTSTTVKATLMDHRDYTESSLSRELYCTDVALGGVLSPGKLVTWDINEGTVTFNKSVKDENNRTYNVTTEVKGLKIEVDGKEFLLDDFKIENITVGWYSGK
jgi:hypothetical protein